ncbi:deazaflavin-dependent oxidoreductase (nitroreductase family) [Mumia flava]|uniref:Deazaflavin-dependent oxidoreductase (Nitroreductase family) n=1 Tax=Mumia flava TaxID=1348852 RepID=A0A0B2B7H7_9ACTN|nr:nitroreductase family deazaflavin-dependent oxidoreductase [Mumia flava]PJJ57760.1 deazaflavin-dependent oxidoreductase (nitroreductase family) [Mumia flava]
MRLLSPFSGLSRVVNPRIRSLARVRPPLALLHHEGRRTGRPYETPVQAYRTATGFVVGLAYGHDADWARNILATGRGQITYGRRRYSLSHPRRRGPEARGDLPAPASAMMRVLGIDDFVEFDATLMGDT